MKKIFLATLMMFTVGGALNPAMAGCDPCKCGPGGDYKGDVGEWFRRNCPDRSAPVNPAPGRPHCPNSVQLVYVSAEGQILGSKMMSEPLQIQEVSEVQ